MSSEDARRAWSAMSQLVLAEDRRASVTHELGLSFARVRALRRLLKAPLTLRELGALLGADPPYTTVLVDDLQERGLVRRTPHPDDRRRKLVHLTDRGRAAAERAKAILDEPPKALTDLPTRDAATLRRLLEQLASVDAPG